MKNPKKFKLELEVEWKKIEWSGGDLKEPGKWQTVGGPPTTRLFVPGA